MPPPREDDQNIGNDFWGDPFPDYLQGKGGHVTCHLKQGRIIYNTGVIAADGNLCRYCVDAGLPCVYQKHKENRCALCASRGRTIAECLGGAPKRRNNDSNASTRNAKKAKRDNSQVRKSDRIKMLPPKSSVFSEDEESSESEPKDDSSKSAAEKVDLGHPEVRPTEKSRETVTIAQHVPQYDNLQTGIELGVVKNQLDNALMRINRLEENEKNALTRINRLEREVQALTQYLNRAVNTPMHTTSTTRKNPSYPPTPSCSEPMTRDQSYEISVAPNLIEPRQPLPLTNQLRTASSTNSETSLRPDSTNQERQDVSVHSGRHPAEVPKFIRRCDTPRVGPRIDYSKLQTLGTLGDGATQDRSEKRKEGSSGI